MRSKLISAGDPLLLVRVRSDQVTMKLPLTQSGVALSSLHARPAR